MPLKKKPVLLTLLIFFLARVLFSIWPSFDNQMSGTDLATFRQWSNLLVQEGLSNFYQKAQFFPYPVVANYFFFLFGKIAQILQIPLNGLVMTAIYKLPNNIGDILTAYLIFILVKPYFKFKVAYLVMLLYLVQPATFFISVIWGQWDGIMSFLIVLAFYLTIQKKIFWGILSLVLGVLIKPQAASFLLPLLVLNYQTSAKKFFLALFLNIVIIFILFYPFFLDDPFLGPLGYFFASLKSFPPRFTSSGFNFWYLLYGGWIDNFPRLLGISTFYWSRILTLAFLIFSVLLTFLRKDLITKTIMLTLSGFSFFLFFTQVHERYFYATLPFLIMASVLSKKRLALIVAIILSFLFAINSIGFYWGWVKFDLWNSTFLSWFYLDRIIALGFVGGFIYFVKLALR